MAKADLVCARMCVSLISFGYLQRIELSNLYDLTLIIVARTVDGFALKMIPTANIMDF